MDSRRLRRSISRFAKRPNLDYCSRSARHYLQCCHFCRSARILGLGNVLTDDFYAKYTAAGTAPSEVAASAAVVYGAFLKGAAVACSPDRYGCRGRPHRPLHFRPGKYRLDAALSLAYAHRFRLPRLRYAQGTACIDARRCRSSVALQCRTVLCPAYNGDRCHCTVYVPTFATTSLCRQPMDSDSGIHCPCRMDHIPQSLTS